MHISWVACYWVIAFTIGMGCKCKRIRLHTDSVILHHALLTTDLLNESVGFFTNKAKLTIMPLLISEALLHENKKIHWKMLPPVGKEPKPLMNLWLQGQHSLSELMQHVLLRGSLNFCSCITLFLDLDDLVEINRVWLYREPKVSVL